ncbi:MAG TPA: ClbS/DfsB family four-helix bundle protein [Anaerolineae bacterium]
MIAHTSAPGADGWAIKDHLAHVTAWEQGLTALLRKQSRYTAMGLTREQGLNSDMDTINAVIFERDRGQSLADVRSAFDDSYRQLLDTLSHLDDADLFKTYSDYDPSEQDEDAKKPILNWIAGDTYTHYTAHSEWIQKMIDGAKA